MEMDAYIYMSVASAVFLAVKVWRDVIYAPHQAQAPSDLILINPS